MRWDRGFSTPIVLRDGRRIATLLNAAEFVSTLSREKRGVLHWRIAVELVVEAAERGGDIGEAWRQLVRALRADGLIPSRD